MEDIYREVVEDAHAGDDADKGPLVLHVIPTPAGRGAQREARALADQLDQPGVRRHRVLSLFDGDEEVRADFSLRFPGRSGPAAGFDPRLVWRLRTALAAHDPAVVVAHGSDPLKFLVPAMVGRRRPLVYYVIGTYAGSPDRRLQLGLWRWLSSRADVVAACGDDVRQECVDLLALPPDMVALVVNGRDPERFAPRPPGPPAAEPLVVFVGALAPTKRPARFIEVVAALRAEGQPLRAQVVGEGPLGSDLVPAAAAAKVDLLGRRPDVPELLRQADLLVFPSEAAGEGMPGVLIEAGLSGLPVVATAVPRGQHHRRGRSHRPGRRRRRLRGPGVGDRPPAGRHPAAGRDGPGGPGPLQERFSVAPPPGPGWPSSARARPAPLIRSRRPAA